MQPRHRYRAVFLAAAVPLGVFLLTGLASSYWLLCQGPTNLPQLLRSLKDLRGYSAAPSSKVYDRNGTLLFEMPARAAGSHSPVVLDEIPQALRQAIVATEDATFYSNPGVDAWAIVRALWINLRGREVLSGGSTITQQLARNLLLSPDERYERTLGRKLREALLAWSLARTHSKDEILELYLNEVYFGNMAYGVEAAAQAYYGKHVGDLDLAECAMLAGLPQAPALYNPLENLKGAKVRQTVVLDLMVQEGYVTPHGARQAAEEQLHFAAAPFPIRAPHFVMYVRGLLERELGLERLEQGGLNIHTTLDLELNETARDVVRHRLERLAVCNGQRDDCPPGGHNVRNAAVVALDPRTGEILAMLGSPDYFSARIDGAVNGTMALRQPGSSIKPITYAAAFERTELTPATMMLDVRTAFTTKEGRPYVPLNYDLRFRGPVRLREALASSYNLIAVKVLNSVGIESMTGLARRMGISTFDEVERLGLALTLGGGEVRLLEETAAYAAFANGGYAVMPAAIQRVEDAQGRLLWSPEPGVGTRVLDERVAYLITDILSDNTARTPSFGEASALVLHRPAAAKTGTTTDFRDNWTVGYTPELVVGVWAGNADNEAMLAVTGLSGAAPIWHDVMEAAHKGRPARSFDRPEGLVEVEVCAMSGLLPEPDCSHRVTELFLDGREPTETCTAHRRVAVDRATGLPATAGTPPGRIVHKVYSVLPPEAGEWTRSAREQSVPEPPLPAEQMVVKRGQQEAPPLPTDGLPLVMSSPAAGAVYRLDPDLPRDAQRILVAARPGRGSSLVEVTLLLDGQLLARFSAPPYQTLWTLAPGKHILTAAAIDVGGQRVLSDEIQVEVHE
jgi:1A family penicillin-binding protein